ncbi:MAG: phosphatidate cytidylyltransferase [Endomicrobium sp.]|jgi:phosphatidate cytidylyltransferase|nr:phosphatidate cytidylyltransferase [Endomicrobium sp.]
MSIDIKNFVIRTLVASIGIPVIVTCIYYGHIVFSVMMIVISVLCVYEYFTMIRKYHIHKNISMIMAVLFSVLLNYNKFNINKNILLYTMLMMLILFSIEIFNGVVTSSIVRISLSFFGIFFIPMTLMHLVYIRTLPHGMEITFFIIIVTWIVDTAAYIIGSLFGIHKLTQNISPRKTLEGSIVGCILGVLISILFRTLLMQQILTMSMTLILGCTISIIGQFSDLAESMIKRDSGIKDSSCLIPGHGGVFDRFDSYIFVAPTVYYILSLCYKL